MCVPFPSSPSPSYSSIAISAASQGLAPVCCQCVVVARASNNSKKYHAFPPPVSRSCLAPLARSLLTTSVDPLDAAQDRGVDTSSSSSIAALLGSAPLLRSKSAALDLPKKHARNSGVTLGGDGGGADSPLWNCNNHFQLHRLIRLVCSLFHLFASLIGRNLLLLDDGAPLLRSAFPPSLHSP